jgi:hypothetical protein
VVRDRLGARRPRRACPARPAGVGRRVRRDREAARVWPWRGNARVRRRSARRRGDSARPCSRRVGGADPRWRRARAVARRCRRGGSRRARAMDAYVLSWRTSDARGRAVECLAALLPSTLTVAEWDIPFGERGRRKRQDLAWASLLGRSGARGSAGDRRRCDSRPTAGLRALISQARRVRTRRSWAGGRLERRRWLCPSPGNRPTLNAHQVGLPPV